MGDVVSDPHGGTWRTPLVRGLRALASGQWASALASFELAHRLAPDVPEVALALGRELIRRGDGERGVLLLERAEYADPPLVTASCELARYHGDRGDVPRALLHLERAHDRRPDDPLPFITRGEVLAVAGDAEAAEQAVLAALARSSGDPAIERAADRILARCYNLRGLRLVAAGELTAAVFAFKSARDRDAEWSAPLINLGTTFSRLGRRRRALEHFSMAEDLDPGDALASYNSALEHDALGQHDAARAALERTIGVLSADDDADPVFLARAHRDLARLHRQAGAWVRAVRNLEVASHLAGAGAEIWAELARAHVACGDLGKARRAARIAMELAPDSPEAQGAWGETCRARRERHKTRPR